jgi:hypothetical protein
MKISARSIPVIDVFAGPGGLGEGFHQFKTTVGINPFKIALSIEKDPYAYQTLRMRSFFRQFPRSEVPGEYYCAIQSELPDWNISFISHPLGGAILMPLVGCSSSDPLERPREVALICKTC